MDTKALRQKILDLAIRGKLVPQDPNDEPASALLEKIRSEKQQMVKEGKLKAKDIKNDTIIFRGEDNLHYEQFQDGTVKCIEEEIPFEVPEGWEWCRLNSISNEIFAGGDKPGDTVKNPDIAHTIPIYSNSIENLGLYGYTSNPRVIVPAITISARGTIGYTCVRKEPFVPIIRLLTIIPSCNINIEYLSLVFMSSIIKSEGSSIPQLTVPSIKTMYIPVPPNNEQKQIFDKVHTALYHISLIDNKIKDLTTIIEETKNKIYDLAICGKLVSQDLNNEPASVLLERIHIEKERLIKQGKMKRDKRESIIFRGDDNSYYEKFADGTTKNIDNEIPFDIPESWVFIRLKNICELISGRDLLPTEYNTDKEGIPYITGASNFVMGKVELVRWTMNPQVVTEVGDLLLTCKGTIGEMALNNFGKAHIARQIMAIRNIYNLNSDYLFLSLRFYINDLKDASKGIIPGISRKDILELIVPMPPVYYQNATVSCIKKLDTALLQIEENLN